MAQPRFLVVAGTPRGRVPGRADAAVSVVWRLVGGNNRELGRGPAPFPGHAACYEAIERLKRLIDRATPIVAVGRSTSAWGWRLEVEGERIAMAGRSYLRQRECQYSLAHFIAAVPSARISGPRPPEPDAKTMQAADEAEPCPAGSQ